MTQQRILLLLLWTLTAMVSNIAVVRSSDDHSWKGGPHPWSTNAIKNLSLSDSTIVPSDTSLFHLKQRQKVFDPSSGSMVYGDIGLIDVNDDIDLLRLFNARQRPYSLDTKRLPDDDEFFISRHRSARYQPPLDLDLRFEPSSHLDCDSTPLDSTKMNYKKTGTTIVGVVGKNYCVLGADSRATSGTMVADKTCWKLHPLSRNCAAAGAGTSADLDHLTRECQYQVQSWLSAWSVGNQPVRIHTDVAPLVPVRQICRYLQGRLYDEGGHCQAHLIVGGVDEGRGVLRALHPDGSMDIVSYTALGSGSLAAMGILESVIKDETHTLSIDEATQLVVQAVKAGIDHDLGSGSQVDVCIITPDGQAKYTRCYLPEETLDDETNSSTDDATETTMTNGINGFGNIPYVVQSKRILRSNLGRDEDRMTLWNDLLAP